MTRLIDRTGHRYGRLLVLSRAENRNGDIIWICHCDCGKEVEVLGESLQSGRTQSCGCLQRDRAKAQLIDRTGRRFGRLIVLCQAESKGRQIAWLCHCDCGKEVEVRGECLQNGHTQSCGCLRSEGVRKRQSLPFGEAAFNQLVSTLKYSAKQRGYSWNLTVEQIRRLTSQVCYYCGKEPSQRGRSLVHSHFNGVYLFNGLDRIDNECGYEIDNVVSCCKDCNYAKRKMTQDEFLAWISRVYNHSASKENETLS